MIFRIWEYRLYYLQVLRALQIIRILIKNGIIEWMGGNKYLRRLVPQKYFNNGVMRSTPERIRIILEDLGPTFVKFGQILADRPDLINEPLRMEFKKLQSKAQPMSDEVAISLIEKELRALIADVFESFDRNCLGSASIGQVYKGVLKDGREVIVKIQRPNIETKIKSDLYLMRFLAKKLVQAYPGLASIDIEGFVEEFGKIIMSELDYFEEASNAQRFYDMFKEYPQCRIPKVYMELSTKKLLVMEFMSGIEPDKVEEMKASGLDPKVIADTGTHIVLKMILKHGFFHGDPHAGNIFIQPGNVIALVDFGMVGVLKPKEMNFLASFTLGFATMNSRMITDSLIMLCGKKYYPLHDELQFSVQDLLNKYEPVPYEKMDFSKILNECVQIIIRHQLKIPSSIYLLLKSLATIEKFGSQLDPDISLSTIIKPYAEDLIKQKYSVKMLANELFDTVSDYAAFIRDFPGEVNEILYKIKEGKLIHEINLQDKAAFARATKEFSQRLALVMIIGFMVVCATILIVFNPESSFGKMLFIISGIFATWILLRLMFRTKI
jgi:ubiquinone biosynthesis protein